MEVAIYLSLIEDFMFFFILCASEVAEMVSIQIKATNNLPTFLAVIFPIQFFPYTCP